MKNFPKYPKLGIPCGHDLYKIRLAIASKGKGKSGVGRVFTYVQNDDNTVVLLSIYNKGEKDTISEKEIHELFERYMKLKMFASVIRSPF